MHRMTRACKITQTVREIVYQRDNERCIICGSNQGLPNAHYIARSHGGLGVEENIVTLCPECHRRYDNGSKRMEYGQIIRRYLQSKYPDWDEQKLIYGRWKKYE